MVVASGTNSFAKEMNIRKRVGNIFNKREEDFPSLREYNDYLEEVEDMIVNLVDGVDVPAIEAKIAQYQQENAEQIMNAQARKAEEFAAAQAASKGQHVQTDVDMTRSWLECLDCHKAVWLCRAPRSPEQAPSSGCQPQTGIMYLQLLEEQSPNLDQHNHFQWGLGMTCMHIIWMMKK